MNTEAEIFQSRSKDPKSVGNRLKIKKMGRFNQFVLWINIFSTFALALSYLASYISPKTFWPIAFFGISYPIWIGINAMLILFWLFQLNKLFLLSLSFILIGIINVFNYVQPTQVELKVEKNDLKVMSYNCMLFDLYNWSNNSKTRNNILDLLKKENPDILCLQEFYNSEDPFDYHNLDALKEIFRNYYIHVEYSHTLRKNDHWGIITLSKFPIINKGKIDFKTKWNNLCIYSDIIIENDTIRIYNTHLASVHFGKKEYTFLNDLISTKETNDLEGSKGVLRLLKQGFQRRAEQVEMINEIQEKCKTPSIICGDFNDPPSSYAYKKIRNNLKDAFIESGKGIGNTYSGKLPTFRIDYILFDEIFQGFNYKEIKVNYTDHYPITTYLRKIK